MSHSFHRLAKNLKQLNIGWCSLKPFFVRKPLRYRLAAGKTAYLSKKIKRILYFLYF